MTWKHRSWPIMSVMYFRLLFDPSSSYSHCSGHRVGLGWAGSLTSLSTQDRLYKRRHLRFKRPSAIGLSTPHEYRDQSHKNSEKNSGSTGGRTWTFRPRGKSITPTPRCSPPQSGQPSISGIYEMNPLYFETYWKELFFKYLIQ